MKENIIIVLVIIVSMLVGKIITDIIEERSRRENIKILNSMIKKREKIDRRIEELENLLNGE